MSFCTGTDKSFIWCILSANSQEEDIVRYGEPSDECMIHILIETDMLVIGSQAINLILFDKDNIVDKRSSTGQMIDSLIISFLKYFDILLGISQ